jgi:hypothetical protein
MVQQPPGPPPGGMQPPPPPPGQPPQAPTGPPKVQLDTSNLPIADIIVAAGSLLAWIMALLPWYKSKWFGDIFDYGGPRWSVTYRGGFQWLPWTIFFVLMLYAGFVIVNRYANLVDLSLPNGLIYLAAGGAGVLFAILAILIRPRGLGWDVVSTMNWVVWIIAIVLSCGPLVGGFLKLQES